MWGFLARLSLSKAQVGAGCLLQGWGIGGRGGSLLPGGGAGGCCVVCVCPPPFPDIHCKRCCHGNGAECWLPPVAMAPPLAQAVLWGPPPPAALAKGWDGTPSPNQLQGGDGPRGHPQSLSAGPWPQRSPPPPPPKLLRVGTQGDGIPRTATLCVCVPPSPGTWGP